MKPPIVVVDSGGDVAVFDSVLGAQSYLEPIDIERGEYRLYASDGKVIHATIDETGGVLARKKVRLEETDEVAVEMLRAAIVDWLLRAMRPIDAAAPIDELLREVVRPQRR